MLTFGGAPMNALPQIPGTYVAPGGSYGGSPAPGMYGAAIYPGGSYAM